MKSLVNTSFDRTSAASRAGRHVRACFPKPIWPLVGLVLSAFRPWMTQEASAASFSVAIPLITERGRQTATLLSNGKLLLAGGQTNGGFTSSVVELYDPGTGSWTMTNPMNADR